MKKKLSLLLFALLAVAAFAGLRGVTASTDVVWQFSDFDFVKNTLGVSLPKANSATYIEEPITYEGVTMTTFKSTNFPGIFINSDGSQISLRIYKISGENKGGIQFSVPEGTKITKIVINGDSKVAQLVADKGTKEMSNSNKTLTWTSDSEEGVQAVKFENDNSSNTVRINDITITKVESGDPQPDYYVVGSMNEWKVNAAYKLTTNAATAGEYMTTLDLPANTELKVVASTDGETISAYYPDQAGNFTINDAGKYDIYFRPDGQGGQDWYYGYIYAKAVEPKPYSTSFNIEQFVLDEGTKADAKAALAAHNIEFANIDALDSLNDEKTARNEPFLGLKVKAQGGFINVVLEKGKKLNVKFGCINAPVNVSIDGTVDEAKQIAANTAGGTVFTLEAGDADREVTFTTTTAKTVVFKQIMIDEDIAEVILPAPLKTFTATFTTNAGWNDVYAYAWTKDAASGEVTKFLGDWPGTKLEGTEGVYTVTIKAEAEPDSIIFNNGAGEQTADLAFEDGKAYSYQLFNVTVSNDIQGGSIGVNPEKCVAGTAVEVYVKPGEDLVLDELYYIGATTQRRADIVDQTFIMPEEDVTVFAKFKEAPQPEVLGYYVVGSMNEWSYDEAYQMQESPTAQGIYEYTARFTAGDEFKVKSKMSEGDGTWYPEGMGNNWTITQDGEYTITFDPNGNQEWQNGFFNVVMKEEPIVVNTFTATFTTNAGWNEVRAYAWTKDAASGEVTKFLGDWPGTPLVPSNNEGEYLLSFQAEAAPDSIIFNNGLENEAKEQTGDLTFVNGTTYTFSEEKTTAWAGDPDVAIPAETGIIIPAKAFAKDEVQAEKIIHIVAKDLTPAAGAKSFNNDVAELKPSDIAILRNEEPFDKVLIEETAIQVVDDGYQFVADNAVAQEITDHGFIIKPLGEKKIGIEYVEVEKAKAPAPVADIVYDFAAAAAAGENPENLNGGTANGAVFYGWENEGKTYSKRQDYKGYTNYTGTNLPTECHVWRRSDRINNNVADGGLKCPNQREMAINGLSAGKKVVIEYTGEGQMLYATGYDPANATAEPNTVAIVGDGNKAAISGTTAIPSGTPIHIVSTDAGYFVFRVLKGMVITKITISDETPIDPATVVMPKKVTVAEGITNGTVKVSQAQACAGDEVTVTTTPADGFKLEAITVTGVNTNEAVTVTDGKFTMIADDVTVSATFADTRVIYDFAAAAAAGENPENLNGGTANGAVFYGWENEGKTYSKRQDYKGYTNYTGTNLPTECHVWRRSDRINNNVADGGLKCPNQREMAINGLSAGSKVVIEYTGEGQMLYATGYDPANATAEPNTVAIVGDGNKAAISGTTAIPSGTPIHIVSTDAGYFVFRVLKDMVITKITISEEATPIDPATVVKPNKVTLGTSEGGTVKVSQAQAFEGDKVYATFTPNDGYLDSGIVPTIKNDADEDVTASIIFGEDENGSYLVMPAFNITVSVVFQPQPKVYIIGGPKEWKLDDMTEMTFNATTQAYEFEYAPTEKAYFAFADKQFTAEEAAADGAWDVFNSTNRYALGTGDVDATLNEVKALQKVNGTIVLKPVKDGTTYKISVAKDLSTVTITGEAAPEAPAKYYLVGSMTDWEIDANYELTPDNENAGQYKINKTFAANDEFKIVNSDKTVWYPDGMDNNYKIDKSANYTVYFKPAGGVEGWYYGFFNVVEDTSTGINGIDAEEANTPIYNLSGQKVTKSYKGVVIKNGKKYMQK